MKTAIVCGGGGMRCAYSAGVLNELSREGYETDILVGSSGSTGSLAYFVAGQTDSIKNIWTNLLTNKNFIDKRRIKRIMDIDYLIDEVFKVQDSLDVERISSSNSRLFISTTNKMTWKSEYFSNEDDIFNSLRASKAIPFFYGKSVNINGNPYIDGSISSPLSVNVEKAIQEGANKILIIRDSLGSERLVLNFYRYVQGFGIRDSLERCLNDEKFLIDVPNNVESHIIQPSRKLRISSLDNSESSLREAFELGSYDLRRNKNLSKLLS